MRIVVTAALLVASVVTTVLSITLLPFNRTRAVEPLVIWTLVLWLLFALSILALRRVPTKAAIILVMIGSVAIGGAAMAGPPNTSTDSARYAWDGIVQNAGISPYDYVPADPALESLRPDWLFPAPVDGACVGSRILTFEEVGTGDLLCTAINRATVPTIYPPAAELYYAAIRAIVPTDATYWPMQLAGLLVSFAVTGLLLRTLVKRNRDPRWAALWGWCPLVATEAVTNSHVDVLGAFLLLLATVLVGSRRRWLGGLALGASIAVKLIPVIGAPPLLRRQPWKLIIASIGVFLLLYVPYIIASGPAVLGYLPGYLSEEGYGTGKRFILLSLVFPGIGSLVVAAIILAVTAIITWWKSNPDNPWLGELVLIGVVLLVVSPRYAWYALLLLPMIAMTGRWEWLAVPLALTERLLVPSIPIAQVSIFIAIVFIGAVSVARMAPEARNHWGRRLRHPLASSRFGTANR
jgi:hypothetical protein